MKKTSSQWIFGLGLSDTICFVLLFFLTPELRQLLPLDWLQNTFLLQDHTWILFLTLLLHITLAPLFSTFQSPRAIGGGSFTSLLKSFVLNFGTQILVISTLVFLLKAQSTSRSFVGLYISSSLLVQLLVRIGLKIMLDHLKPNSYQKRRVLLIADEPNSSLLEQLRNDPQWQAEIVAVTSVSKLKEGFAEQFLFNPIDDCIVDCDVGVIDQTTEILKILNTRGVQIHFTFKCLPLSHGHFGLNLLDHRPLLSTQKSILTTEAKTLKRLVDVFFSLIGCTTTILLTPFIAIIIKLDSQGPIFFSQQRVGHGGRRFRCYKFRTMIHDAEALKASLQNHNQMQGPIFKMKDDPRVTRVGQILRRTSLDELPQFFNILRGEMSLIGTRPPTPHEVEQYSHSDFRRVSIKPGLTGLWQVSGRNEINQFQDIVALDLFYIDHWSLWLDLKIILRTLYVLFARKGAS